LDYLVKTREATGGTDSARTDFEGSIVDHLKNAYGKEYTIAQVRHKIQYVWSIWGRDDSRSSSDAYRLGMACLVHIPPEYGAEIKQRVEMFADEALVQTLSGPRQLRSSSHSNTANGPSRFTSLETLENIVRSPRKREIEVVINQSPGPVARHKRFKSEVTAVRLEFLLELQARLWLG
jgi:hypothetical protein